MEESLHHTRLALASLRQAVEGADDAELQDKAKLVCLAFRKLHAKVSLLKHARASIDRMSQATIISAFQAAVDLLDRAAARVTLCAEFAESVKYKLEEIQSWARHDVHSLALALAV